MRVEDDASPPLHLPRGPRPDLTEDRHLHAVARARHASPRPADAPPAHPQRRVGARAAWILAAAVVAAVVAAGAAVWLARRRFSEAAGESEKPSLSPSCFVPAAPRLDAEPAAARALEAAAVRRRALAERPVIRVVDDFRLAPPAVIESPAPHPPTVSIEPERWSREEIRDVLRGVVPTAEVLWAALAIGGLCLAIARLAWATNATSPLAVAAPLVMGLGSLARYAWIARGAGARPRSR